MKIHPTVIGTKDELSALLRHKVCIYGAGKLANRVLNLYNKDFSENIKFIFVSDKENNPSQLCGHMIKSITDRDLVKNENLLICTNTQNRSEILKLLEDDIEFRGGVFIFSDYLERNFLQNELEFSEEVDRLIWRTTTHPIIESCIINIVDHCNLNCAGCDHFSCIASPHEVSIDVLDRDLDRLSNLLEGRINTLRVMGGEPLLHSHFSEVIRLVRKYFAQQTIEVWSNGILLKNMDTNLWKLCKKLEIVFQITKYPIPLDYESIKMKAESHGVKYLYWAGDTAIKTLYKEPLDLSGRQDPVYSFMHCSLAQMCIMLSYGKLFPCTIAPTIHIFNSRFNTNIPITDADGIDIYKVENGDALLEKLSRPMPICRFCDVRHRTFGYEWHMTSGDIREWT